MCPGATMDYLASALLPALSFNNPTTLSSHQLITWHFFLVQCLSVRLPLYWPGLWKGDFVWLRVSSLWSFFEAGGLCWLRLEVASAMFWGLEIKVPCCSIRGISSIFPSGRKRNLACQSWQCLSSFAVRTKLSLWVGLPLCAFRKNEETNLSVLLTMNPKSCCVNHSPR